MKWRGRRRGTHYYLTSCSVSEPDILAFAHGIRSPLSGSRDCRFFRGVLYSRPVLFFPGRKFVLADWGELQNRGTIVKTAVLCLYSRYDIQVFKNKNRKYNALKPHPWVVRLLNHLERELTTLWSVGSTEGGALMCIWETINCQEMICFKSLFNYLLNSAMQIPPSPQKNLRYEATFLSPL